MLKLEYSYTYVCNNMLTEVLIHYNGKEKNFCMQESVNVIGLVSVIVDKKGSNIADERLVNIGSNPVTLNVKKDNNNLPKKQENHHEIVLLCSPEMHMKHFFTFIELSTYLYLYIALFT